MIGISTLTLLVNTSRDDGRRAKTPMDGGVVDAPYFSASRPLIYDYEERSSDSPFIEAVWHNYSVSGGSFIALAASHWVMVVTKHHGRATVTLRGPDTRAKPVDCPADAEQFGIIFKLGMFMPNLPASSLLDRGVNLPEAMHRSFWLNGSAWQFPDYENLDTFVDRLVREGVLVYEPIVDVALQGNPMKLSLRTVQRRFLRATGLTHGVVCQINRARYATILLKQGISILDTIDQAGYADQPHLTRSLKNYIGQTPGQLIRISEPGPLSFLFKTAPL